MTEQEAEQFEIPTDRPLVVEFKPGGGFLRRDYLGISVAAPPDNAAC
jgi:hypothetical protein